MKYNKKQFLLPNSLNSCALYHAKIMPSGEYMFRVHDCNTGIRLRGTLTTEQDINLQTGEKNILLPNRENECVYTKM